jgi:hypothetical protein
LGNAFEKRMDVRAWRFGLSVKIEGDFGFLPAFRHSHRSALQAQLPKPLFEFYLQNWSWVAHDEIADEPVVDVGQQRFERVMSARVDSFGMTNLSGASLQ